MPLFAMAETEEIKFRVTSLGFDIIKNFSVAHKKRKFNLFSFLATGLWGGPPTRHQSIPAPISDRGPSQRRARPLSPGSPGG